MMSLVSTALRRPWQLPIRRCAGSLALLLVAGCSANTPVEAPRHSEDPLPTPTWRPYRIQVDDILDIAFWGDSELDIGVTVRPDGMISLPYVDDVRAAGLTPAELDTELTRRYATELKSPQLTVIVSGAGGQQIYIGGEVESRGTLRLTQNMTLMQAIYEVGGFSTSSRRKQVLLIRTMSDGERIARSIDVRPMLSGADLSQDVPLQGNDVIYVPRTKIANVNLWVDQYINQIIPLDSLLNAVVFREIFEDNDTAAAVDLTDDILGDDDDTTGDDGTGGDGTGDDDTGGDDTGGDGTGGDGTGGDGTGDTPNPGGGRS